MATFDDYWKRLQDRNEGMRTEEAVMRITVASFRKSLEQAYKRGESDQREFRASIDKLAGKANPLGGMFGF